MKLSCQALVEGAAPPPSPVAVVFSYFLSVMQPPPQFLASFLASFLVLVPSESLGGSAIPSEWMGSGSLAT